MILYLKIDDNAKVIAISKDPLMDYEAISVNPTYSDQIQSNYRKYRLDRYTDRLVPPNSFSPTDEVPSVDVSENNNGGTDSNVNNNDIQQMQNEINDLKNRLNKMKLSGVTLKDFM